MADPIPPVDDSFLRANEALAALKKTRPRSVTEARNRAVELSRLNGILSKATKEVTETQARARVATGSNGAQSVQGEAAALSDELINALARGTVKTIAAVVKPLKERIAKLEGSARKVETRRALTWVCEDASAAKDSGLRCEECGSCGPRMRSGPTLLDAVWLAIAKRREEFLCGACVQQRCRERLGRELRADDLRGGDANRAWIAVLGARHHDK